MIVYLMEQKHPLYKVKILKKVEKSLKKMPLEQQKKLYLLIEDIKKNGAIQKGWKNFSSLGDDKYHCHLSLHWIACWTWKKGTFLVEVYYAGSREKAPY